MVFKDLTWLYAYNENHSLYTQRVNTYIKNKELRVIGQTTGNIITLIKYICPDVNYLLLDRCIFMTMSDQRLLSSFCKRKQIHIIVI